eukprot:6186142-Pleurochrysis_carterae.AAC.5
MLDCQLVSGHPARDHQQNKNASRVAYSNAKKYLFPATTTKMSLVSIPFKVTPNAPSRCTKMPAATRNMRQRILGCPELVSERVATSPERTVACARAHQRSRHIESSCAAFPLAS